MDSFEWNKIIGAVLFALLVAFGLSIFSGIFFSTEAPEEPGYTIATAESAGGEGAGKAGPEPIAVRLASADAGAGERSAKKCLACHTFGQGEANKVGPNLWGVVGRPIAAHEGYDYSDAMKAHAEEDKSWTYEHLDTFLTDPRKVVPGTKMAFAGLKNGGERANVIAFLRTLSDNPEPLPEPQAAATTPEAGAAAPAGSDAKPADTQGTVEPAPADSGAAPAASETPAAAGGGDAMQSDSTSGDSTSGGAMQSDSMSGDSASGGAMQGDSMSGDSMSGDSMSGDSMSGGAMQPAEEKPAGQ